MRGVLLPKSTRQSRSRNWSNQDFELLKVGPVWAFSHGRLKTQSRICWNFFGLWSFFTYQPRAHHLTSPTPCALVATLISSRLSTGVLQIGHLLLCPRNILAHAPHMHMCRHANAVVSRGSLIHTTHSFPLSSPSPLSSPLSASFACYLHSRCSRLSAWPG